MSSWKELADVAAALQNLKWALGLLSTMEQSPDGIWIIDAEAQTVYANARMAAILRTTVADMVGHPSFGFVYPEDVSQAQQLFDSKKKGNLAPFRFRLRRRDDTPVWVMAQGTPMKNAQGAFMGIVGTFTPTD